MSQRSLLAEPAEPKRSRDDVEPVAASRDSHGPPRSKREHIQGWVVYEDHDSLTVRAIVGGDINHWRRCPDGFWEHYRTTPPR